MSSPTATIRLNGGPYNGQTREMPEPLEARLNAPYLDAADWQFSWFSQPFQNDKYGRYLIAEAGRTRPRKIHVAIYRQDKDDPTLYHYDRDRDLPTFSV